MDPRPRRSTVSPRGTLGLARGGPVDPEGNPTMIETRPPHVDALALMDERLARHRQLERLSERRADEHDERRMRSLTGLARVLIVTDSTSRFQRIRAEGGDED